MQLCELLPNAEMTPDVAHIPITGISADSRRLKTGALFVAIAGTTLDGHEFIPQAVSSGASAILCERRHDDVDIPQIVSDNIRKDYATACALFWPKRPAMQVAITGTNGKTSIAEFLRQIWQKATWSAASLGTLGATGSHGNVTATSPALPQSALTTPNAEDLFATIDHLARHATRCLALEASSHGIDQHRLSPLSVHVAGFSNLSRDHLDYHGSMDAYFEAKKRLFTEILPDGAAAAINCDDAYGKELIEALKDRSIVLKSVGTSPEADLYIKSLTPQDYGFDAELVFEGKQRCYPLALKGRFQAENAILAALLAHLSGLSVDDSFGALASLKPIPGRMQPVHGHPQQAEILVDYAHTPDALENALLQLRPETKGKLFVLFGCGGDRDKGKRSLMGEVAVRLSDGVYVTDDNPRSENPAAIRAEIMAKADDKFIEIGNRKAAIQTAIDALGKGDCLLIAGKGHETSQTVGHETLPFDDSAVARSALAFLPTHKGDLS